MPERNSVINYWTVSQWAKAAGTTRTNAYYWLRRLKIPVHKVGGHIMIPETMIQASLIQFKAAQEEATTKKK